MFKKQSVQTPFQVSQADRSDTEAWLSLALSVEHLFGPMIGHGFERALEANISRGSAYCVRNPDDPQTLGAGIFFDGRQKPLYHVSWLAVHETLRRCGLGRLLLEYATGQTVRPCRIEVVTFAEGQPGGNPARAFYEALGFRPASVGTVHPDGGAREQYVLKVDGWVEEETG